MPIPDKYRDLLQKKTLATLATLMTGCIAGIFSSGAGVLTR